jgi:F-type H+-transporting ATPase subunit c
MKKALLMVFLIGAFAIPSFAAEEGAAGSSGGGLKLGVLAAAFAIGLVGMAGAFGQGKAIAAACDGLARNPGAAGPIRTTLLLGLAFIESVVIYALLIALLAYKL